MEHARDMFATLCLLIFALFFMHTARGCSALEDAKMIAIKKIEKGCP